MNAFGTPNLVWALDLCGWGRGFATRYVYGVGSVATGSAGGAMADIDSAGCLMLWGYNPSFSRLTHATATVDALKRGMKLIVIDPRNAGLANKADIWLRVRPGTDGALALGLANLMIQRGWYDRDFMRRWTNGPLLVRPDTGRLLRESELSAGGDARRYVAWHERDDRPVVIRPGDGPLRWRERRRRALGYVSRFHDGGHGRMPHRLRSLRAAVRKAIRPKWSRRPAGFRRRSSRRPRA